jgi:hypothetical protein
MVMKNSMKNHGQLRSNQRKRRSSSMRLRSGRLVLRDTFIKMCRRSARQRLRSAGEPDPEGLDAFLETLKQPRAMDLEQPTTIACERAPASDPESVDPETIIQPAHSPVFIFRVAAHRMQAQVEARARPPPAQHDDLLAEPAWDWEGFVRSMNDELGLPN